MPLKDTQQLPDVILSPLDSRNYADQGMYCSIFFIIIIIIIIFYLYSYTLLFILYITVYILYIICCRLPYTYIYQYTVYYIWSLYLSILYYTLDYTRKRIAMDRHDSWELRCGFLESEILRTRYGYAMTPFPNLGGLDLAGLFMDRKKFVATGVYFSKLLLLVLLL